jgi:mannitol operon repressor
MAKRTLQDFARTVSVIDQFLKEFQAETDRGTVLIAGAYLDDLLASLLRAFFVDDPKIVNGLITIDGPLGTFATRIDLTYCLGLIRSDQHEDLHTCRKIRNLCAHSHKRISFDEQPIIDLCRNLKQIHLVEQLRVRSWCFL